MFKTEFKSSSTDSSFLKVYANIEKTLSIALEAKNHKQLIPKSGID